MKRIIFILFFQIFGLSVSAETLNEESVLGVWCESFGHQKHFYKFTKASIQYKVVTSGGFLYEDRWFKTVLDNYTCDKDYKECTATTTTKTNPDQHFTGSYTFTTFYDELRIDKNHPGGGGILAFAERCSW